MKINPKHGIDKLIFGMKQSDVDSVYGKADKQYEDEEGNIVLLYNDKKLRLTFYEDEDFRLGYIITSAPETLLFEKPVIGKTLKDVKNSLAMNGLTKWTEDNFDSYENYINEDNWVTLQSEFGEIVKVEFGADITDDEFVWKFKP